METASLSTRSATAPPGRRRAPPLAGMAGLYAALLALVVAFHLGSGSERSELGAHPDEAAHFVTGLMVRDYLRSGFHEAPLRYADGYYRHYPKIGLGNWPPVFYILQAAWMLVFPPGVGTVLHLVSALGLVLALVTGWWLWRDFGPVEAAAGTVLLTALPLVQMYSNMVMAEVLSALLMFGAAGYFARYLEGEEWPGAVGFGLCAGLSIMTKGTGLALAFVPPFAIAFTGRSDLLRRASLWVAALLAALIAGPWTWHFRGQANAGWVEPHPTLRFTEGAVGYYGLEICVALGWMLTLLALLGAVSLFRPGGKRPAIALCSLALVMGVWIFQCLMPVGLEARHLMPAMPALVVLAMAGLGVLTRRCRSGARVAVAGGLMAVFFAWPVIFRPPAPVPGYGSLGSRVSVSPFRVPAKKWGGFEPVAEAAMEAGPETRILVASDARGEGMFIADVAELDPKRPSYTVERASKLMASSKWSGLGYRSLYTTPAEVLAMLGQSGIGTVVTDVSPERIPPHDQLLLRAVGPPPSPFASMGTWTIIRDGTEMPAAAEVFRRATAH